MAGEWHYYVGLGPDSCWCAFCAAIVGNRGSYLGNPGSFPVRVLIFMDNRLCRGVAAVGILVIFRGRSATWGRHRTPKNGPGLSSGQRPLSRPQSFS